MKTLIVLGAIVCSSLGLHLPEGFKTCPQSGPDHTECVRAAIEDALPRLANGLPEFNFPVSQPVSVPSMTIGEGSGAVHVVQKFKDVKMYNLISPKISNAKGDALADKFWLEGLLNYDEVRLEADYDFNGRILVLPIVGQGKCTITLKKLHAHINITGDVIKKKGVEYGEVKDFKVTLNPERVAYHFENLFNGDERLGKEMNNLLNENWKEVFDDVKSGYEEIFGAIFKNLANIIFKKVPYNEVFPK